MSRDDANWNPTNGLLNDFLKRYQISPAKVQAAQVLDLARELVMQHFPEHHPLIEVVRFQAPELVLAVRDPMLAQEVRGQSVVLERAFQSTLGADGVAIKLRVVGRA